MSKNFQELMKEITDWQDKIFTEATPLSAAEHLRREVKELVFDIVYKNPKSVRYELADCFLLVIGVAHLSGVDLEAAIAEKLEINKKREWGKPDAFGVVEHIREEIDHERDEKISEWVYQKDIGALKYEGETEKWQGKTLLEVFEEEGLIPPAFSEDWEKTLVFLKPNPDDLFHGSTRQGDDDGQVQND